MVIDTSAVLAILQDEADAPAVEAAIEKDPIRIMAAPSALEAAIVIEARHGEAGGRELDLLLHRARIEIVAFDAGQMELARQAYRRFGKGRHGAGLNFGDCFAYALSRRSGEPLLFVGADFPQTDVAAVPVPAVDRPRPLLSDNDGEAEPPATDPVDGSPIDPPRRQQRVAGATPRRRRSGP